MQELRTKNWKVMEALSAAESRAKSNNGKGIVVSFYFARGNMRFFNFILFMYY